MIFDPDNFANDPYTAGLNQIGHMVFGAALAVYLGWYAGFLVIAWEGWQYHKRGALQSDYWADWVFWTYGIFAVYWTHFLPSVVAIGGAWMFLKWVIKEGDDIDGGWYV